MALKKSEKKTNDIFVNFADMLRKISNFSSIAACQMGHTWCRILQTTLGAGPIVNHSRKPCITSTDKKLKATVSAPGANYCNGCQTSNVWRRNTSRSRESRPRGSRKQQTKITFAARARTLTLLHGAQGFALLAHSLLLDDLIMQYEYDKYATQSVRSEKNSELYHH